MTDRRELTPRAKIGNRGSATVTTGIGAAQHTGETMIRKVPGLKAAELGNALVDELQLRGLGAMAKRELDALLLFLLERNSTIGSLSNHEAGLLLRAPASRIKALRQEAMYRFVDDLTQFARQRLLEALKTSRYNGKTDSLTLVVEDGIGRDALLAALKAERSFGVSNPGNSEVIEAPSDSVISLLERVLPPEELESFLKAVNKGCPSKVRKTFREVMRAVFDEVKSRSAEGVVDMAKDQVGQHIGDLSKLVTLAVSILT